MNSSDLSRRSFLKNSAGIAIGAVMVGSVHAQAGARPEPVGAVYGRAGKHGISPIGPAGKGRGDVVLLDGTTIPTSHDGSQPIAPGKSVLLSPDGEGGWSVLYAEM